MVTVVTITVLLLALVPSTMGQLTTEIIANCLEGDAAAGSTGVCPVGGLCDVAGKNHHNRLFIVEDKYGLKCDGNGGFRLDKCIAETDVNTYTTLSDKDLNNLRSKNAFKGPDDDTEVWKLCDHLAKNKAEWDKYEEDLKPVAMSGVELFDEYANGAYIVTTTAGGAGSDKVATLQYTATLPGQPAQDLATIFAPLAFTAARGCNVAGGARPNTFNGVTYFVDDKALYTCAGQVLNAVPAFIGCLTEEVVDVDFMLIDAQMQHLPETDLVRLRALYTCIAFTYQAAKIPMDNIEGLMHKPLCKAIYDGLRDDESCLNVESPSKPAARKSTAAGLTWFTPKFKLQ